MNTPHSRRACLLALVAIALPMLACGCQSNHSALHPHGVQAARINGLWWFFFWVTTAVYVIVLAFTIGVIIRGNIRRPLPITDKNEVVIGPATERKTTLIVASAVGLTLITLLVLLSSDVFAGSALHSLGADNPVSIRLTGHQWWWEAEYNFPVQSNIVTTANEIHIPVGVPVQVQLQSHDVIHSFWVPSLHGKKDLIPGHPTAVWLRADAAGTYAGQCAEYCGAQHAHMRLLVIAENEASYEQWLAAQRLPAPDPVTNRTRRGQTVFLTGTCVMCHSIQGTIAGARLGPNLTHVASRQTLAAGRLKNNRGSLAGWVLDPQHLKPGVLMPQNQLAPQDLHALLDYLETLK
jgi:cytochrome c oxidase subunit 2